MPAGARFPPSPHRKTRIAALVLLLLASTLFALLLCEIGLRLFTRYGAPAWYRSAGKRIDIGDADQYIAGIQAARGTLRQWFREDPPPLPNRAAVSAQRKERYHDYQRRGIFPPQADYIWNRYFLESQRCTAGGPFQKFPATVSVFDPPQVTFYPHYRFPPNITTAGQLVTNEFGLRGRPLAPAKPPRTVRIAFLGASTTIGYHYFAFSYPERVVHWLNRFAESDRYNVRFEMLNGGREGLNSRDSAQILKDELLPLDPDLAVYYEGANQFASATDLVSPRIRPRAQLDPNDAVVQHKVPQFVRAHLALGNLADRALNGFQTAGEPRKPVYRLQWPAGVDERHPAVDDPRLPLKLPEIVGDLDSIRTSLAAVGARLVLCSFQWLAEAGMPLSPARHQYIYQQLNTTLWPLRYGDIRRLADFQNRVFRRYAETRKIDFLDVAAAIPQDPDLFIDAIHMTEIGERIRAWITFQQLVPVVRRLIESGQLPRTAQTDRLPPTPSLAISEATIACGDRPGQPLLRLQDALSLDRIALAYPDAQIRLGHPVEVVTAELPTSHAATIPFHIPGDLTGARYVFLRARVLAGEVNVGILEVVNGKHTDPQLEKHLTPSLGTIDIYIPVPSAQRFDALVIANGAGRVRSKILLEDAALLVSSRPPTVARQKGGVPVSTKREPGAYEQ